MKSTMVLVLVVIMLAGVKSENSHVYCGRQLAQSLVALCENDYLVKRSAFPWLPARAAHRFQPARSKRGIVDECCNKPCSLDELLSYC